MYMRRLFIVMRDKSAAWARAYAQGPYAHSSIFIIAFVESIFFPIPVDPFLIPPIVLRVRSWKYYTLLATVGSIAGGIAGYAVGFFLFSFVGSSIIDWYGLGSAFTRVQEMLAQNALFAAFLSAFTPIPFKVFTLSAGFLAAPFFLFIGGSFAGRLLRYGLVCFVAHRYGGAIAQLFMRSVSRTLIILLCIAGGAYIVYLVVSSLL